MLSIFSCIVWPVVTGMTFLNMMMYNICLRLFLTWWVHFMSSNYKLRIHRSSCVSLSIWPIYPLLPHPSLLLHCQMSQPSLPSPRTLITWCTPPPSWFAPLQLISCYTASTSSVRLLPPLLSLISLRNSISAHLTLLIPSTSSPPTHLSPTPHFTLPALSPTPSLTHPPPNTSFYTQSPNTSNPFSFFYTRPLPNISFFTQSPNTSNSLPFDYTSSQPNHFLLHPIT